jgi:transcriptional regulator with XRE-family HTH domain
MPGFMDLRVCAATGRATVTRHEIARYEREARIPTRASLTPLAAALRVPVSLLDQAARFTGVRRTLEDLGRNLHR